MSSKLLLLVLLLRIVALSCTTASKTSSNELKYSNGIWSGPATEVSEGTINPRSSRTKVFDFNKHPSVIAGVSTGLEYILKSDATQAWSNALSQLGTEGHKYVIRALDTVYEFKVGTASLMITNLSKDDLQLDGPSVVSCMNSLLNSRFKEHDPNNGNAPADLGSWVAFFTESFVGQLHIGFSVPPPEGGASLP